MGHLNNISLKPRPSTNLNRVIRLFASRIILLKFFCSLAACAHFGQADVNYALNDDHYSGDAAADGECVGTSNTLTIDDAMATERPLSAIAVPSENLVVFEMVGGYGTSTRGQYFDGWFSYLNRTRLMVKEPGSEEAARELFPHEPDKGYFGAKLSPDASHLVFFRMHRHAIDIGIYTFKDSAVRFYEVNVDYLFLRPQPHFIADNEILFFDKAQDLDVNQRIERNVQTSRLQHEARELAWRNEKASFDLIGSGVFSDYRKTWPEQTPTVLDVKTGETRRLSPHRFYDYEISPDGRYLAGVVEDQLSNPIGSGYVSVLSPRKQHRIIIVDLQSGEEYSPCNQCDVSRVLLSWSSNGGALLFFDRTSGDYSVYDLKSEATRHLFSPPADSQRNGAQEALEATMPRAFWVGDVVVANTAALHAKRDEWYSIDRSGNKNRLAAVSLGKPIEPAAIGKSVVYFTNGDVVQSIDVITGQVDAVLDFSVSDISIARAARVSRRTRLNSVLPLSETVFRAQNGEEDCFFALDQSHGQRWRVCNERDGKQVVGIHADLPAISYSRQNDDSSLSLQVVSESKTLVLTEFNTHLRCITAASEIPVRYTTNDGAELTGWLFLPSKQPEGVPAPLVVVPYPGISYASSDPSGGMYDSIADVNLSVSPQLLTASGYAVLLPSLPVELVRSNPVRGSVELIERSLQAAIDTGLVDPDSVAISGHSYGGYIVYATLSRSDLFSVGIAAAASYNLTSKYGQDSPPTRFWPDSTITGAVGWMELGQGAMGAPPWEARERYIENSPLFFADEIDAPILIIHGEYDFVSIAQAEEAYNSLARQGKDVLFLRYWGEGHSIDSPVNARDMWQRKIDFLDRYLK